MCFCNGARSGSCAATLVHCGAGVSRSACLCIAYLMRSRRWSAQAALDHCKARRWVLATVPREPQAVRHQCTVVTQGCHLGAAGWLQQLDLHAAAGTAGLACRPCKLYFLAVRCSCWTNGKMDVQCKLALAHLVHKQCSQLLISAVSTWFRLWLLFIKGGCHHQRQVCSCACLLKLKAHTGPSSSPMMGSGSDCALWRRLWASLTGLWLVFSPLCPELGQPALTTIPLARMLHPYAPQPHFLHLTALLAHTV